VELDRFDGWIAAFGTAAGHRFVTGVWARSPLGVFADVMWERPDGRRILLAPNASVADFVGATYRYDEVRTAGVSFARRGQEWSVDAGPVRLSLTPGPRDAVGRLLAAVPRSVRRTRWFAIAADIPARYVLPGVRTRGRGLGGRRMYYCAQDHRPLAAGRAWLDGVDLGGPRPLTPPVTFGFSSAPAKPAWVRVVTLVERRA